MAPTTLVTEANHIDEPQRIQEFAAVLSKVAADKQPIVLRRGGADLAAVVTLEHLELLRNAVARQEAESLAAQLDWDRIVRSKPPPQEWFDGDEPKPF